VEIDKTEFATALNVAKHGTAQQKFIPILGHLCFDRKHVLAYNDNIAVQVALHTNLECAIDSDTLLSFVANTPGKPIKINVRSDVIALQCGRTKLNVPYLPKSDFVFEMVSDRKLKAATMKPKMAARFFDGLSKCLSSVSDNPQHRSQMGITLSERKGKLMMYSTNNRTISRCSIKGWSGIGVTDLIMPTMFCRALLKARDVYADEAVSLRVGAGYITVRFGDRAALYAKALDNTAPLDFEKVIKKHMGGVLERSTAVNEEMRSVYKRAALMVARELDRSVEVVLNLRSMQVTARSKLGTMRDKYVLPEWLGDFTFRVDPELALSALNVADKVAFNQNVMVATSGTYTQLVALQMHDPSKSEE
jgi:DNA polymerase III sliding clamp (beta) subunit (PCNA family)